MLGCGSSLQHQNSCLIVLIAEPVVLQGVRSDMPLAIVPKLDREDKKFSLRQPMRLVFVPMMAIKSK